MNGQERKVAFRAWQKDVANSTTELGFMHWCDMWWRPGQHEWTAYHDPVRFEALQKQELTGAQKEWAAKFPALKAMEIQLGHDVARIQPAKLQSMVSVATVTHENYAKLPHCAHHARHAKQWLDYLKALQNHGG